MRRYPGVFRKRFAAGLPYRTAALAGVLTRFAWGGMAIPAAYRDGTFPPLAGLHLLQNGNGQAQFQVDTSILSVSDAVRHLSSGADIRDLTVSSATAEELVVSLYEEFSI